MQHNAWAHQKAFASSHLAVEVGACRAWHGDCSLRQVQRHTVAIILIAASARPTGLNTTFYKETS